MDELDAVLSRLESRLGRVTAGPVPLQGGITNRNYRIRFGECDCVVRLPGKQTALLGISRAAERIATQTAAELGIAPRVVAGDDGCLVTAYVEGTAADAASVKAAPERIGAVLRSFHDSGVQLPIRFWVPELLDAYAELVLTRGGSLPDQYAQSRQLAGQIAELLPLSDPVPCHDDLLPANVLRVRDGATIMLVDWEYAGMGHRLFDLGNLAVNAELGPSEEARLLTAYLGEAPSGQQSAALRLMRIMSDAREAAWGVLQNVISDIDFDFEGYAARHFDRLDAASRDPRLEEWLDAAAA